jgi:hypothetical protein
MPIIQGHSHTPAPEGEHNAVCVDVTDIEMRETAWGVKPKIRAVWELDAKMPDGRPFVVGKTYTASLDQKATLRKDLKTWRGRDFTPEEARAFDTERLIGAPCRVIIAHAERDGETYANVETVLRAGQVKLAPTGKYVRKKDRKDEQAGGAGRVAADNDGGDGTGTLADHDLPF